MINYIRRLSTFIDPHSINELLSKSKSVYQVLEHFNHQKSVFSIKDHGVSLLNQLIKLKKDETISNAMNDPRFKDFLQMINQETSLEVYLENLLQLSSIYKSHSLEIHPEVKKQFNRKMLDHIKGMSISNSSTCLTIISSVLSNDHIFMKHATILIKQIPELLTTENPSIQDITKIINSSLSL